METEYVLDAHTLVWMLEGNEQLGESARAVLNDPTATLVLPVIALAEACWVAKKGKTSIPDWRQIVEAVAGDPRILVVPLDLAIVHKSMTLGVSLEMHDSQIVATALVRATESRRVMLLTRDQSMVSSGLIAIVW